MGNSITVEKSVQNSRHARCLDSAEMDVDALYQQREHSVHASIDACVKTPVRLNPRGFVAEVLDEDSEIFSYQPDVGTIGCRVSQQEDKMIKIRIYGPSTVYVQHNGVVLMCHGNE